MGSEARAREAQSTPRLVPVSFSSGRVIASDGQLGFAFAAQESKEGGRLNVENSKAAQLRPSYVYLFATGESVENVVERLPKDTVQNFLLAKALGESSANNYLIYVLQRESGGKYSIAAGKEASDSIEAGREPAFGPAVDSFALPTVAGLEYFAWGLPHLVDKDGLSRLIAETPADKNITFSALDTALPYFDVKESNPASYCCVLPVLSPLHVLSGTAAKYKEACDAYLQHSSDYPATKGASKSATTDQGSVAFFKYQSALVVKELTESAVSDAGASRRADDFIRKYEAKREELRDAREAAAYDLISILESPAMTLCEKLLRKSKGEFLSEQRAGATRKQANFYFYQEYAEIVALAEARLNESDRGKAYLIQCIDSLDKAEGSRKIIADFVLTQSTPGAEVTEVARNAAGPLFDLWGALFPLVSTKVSSGSGSYLISGENYRDMNQVARKLCQQVAYMFDGNVIDVVHNTAINMQIRIQDKLAELYVDEVRLGLSAKSAAGALQKVNISVDAASTTLDCLNTVLAVASVREAMKKGKLDLEAYNSALDFAQALVFVGQQLTLSSQLVRLRKAIFGDSVDKVIKKRFQIVASCIDLLGAGPAAYDSYQKHDWNKSFAEGVKGAGAIITLGALAVSGPAGWVAFGYALSIGGSIWSDLVTDSPYDDLVKFSAFGAWSPSAKMDAQDKAWTVADSYADWNPSKRDGLMTHLAAANQMQYSFRVKGATFPGVGPLASDGAVELTVGQLLPNSVFYLDINAEYKPFNPGGPTRKPLMGLVELHFKEGLTVPTLKDRTGELEMTGSVLAARTDAGEHQFLVRFKLKQSPAGLTLQTLTVKVRLDVLGDGVPADDFKSASVLVPTKKEGKKWVKLEKRPQLSDLDYKSYVVDDLA